MPIDAAAWAELVALAGVPAAAVQAPDAGSVPARTTLTVGMATYDDYDGVYFTVMSLRLYHPEVADRISILILDNHPAGDVAPGLKGLERIPGVRYVPVDDVVSTAVRTRLFTEANSDWVLCIDSHVQLLPGALAALLRFIDDDPQCPDLVQGPLMADNGATMGTDWAPTWRQGMLGTWRTDPRGADPQGPAFEIEMQGLGLFAARADAWLGFPAAFRGHGGEEGYIHQKYRAAGRRTLCLPALRWTHRFDPFARMGPAPATGEDRLRNYLIGWEDLGLDTEPVLEHFRQISGIEAVAGVVAAWEREKNSPFIRFDAIFCINLTRRPDRRQAMARRFTELGIASRVRWVTGVDTPENTDIGCALSHRRALEMAEREGLGHVLVFEDDARFLDGTGWVLRKALDELPPQRWDVLYLGGMDWGREYKAAAGCSWLEEVDGVTTAHALAYHQTYRRHLLDALPADRDGMTEWIAEHAAIDQYLARHPALRALRVRPVVATQSELLGVGDPDLRDQFRP